MNALAASCDLAPGGMPNILAAIAPAAPQDPGFLHFIHAIFSVPAPERNSDIVAVDVDDAPVAASANVIADALIRSMLSSNAPFAKPAPADASIGPTLSQSAATVRPRFSAVETPPVSNDAAPALPDEPAAENANIPPDGRGYYRHGDSSGETVPSVRMGWSAELFTQPLTGARSTDLADTAAAVKPRFGDIKQPLVPNDVPSALPDEPANPASTSLCENIATPPHPHAWGCHTHAESASFKAPPVRIGWSRELFTQPLTGARRADPADAAAAVRPGFGDIKTPPVPNDTPSVPFDEPANPALTGAGGGRSATAVAPLPLIEESAPITALAPIASKDSVKQPVIDPKHFFSGPRPHKIVRQPMDPSAAASLQTNAAIPVVQAPVKQLVDIAPDPVESDAQQPVAIHPDQTEAPQARVQNGATEVAFKATLSLLENDSKDEKREGGDEIVPPAARQVERRDPSMKIVAPAAISPVSNHVPQSFDLPVAHERPVAPAEAKAEAPFRAVAETLRTAQTEAPAIDNPRSSPVHSIALRIAPPESPAVELHVRERGGEIHVAVRTPDAALQTVLREDLGTLSNSLERAGYRAQTFVPRESVMQTARAMQNDFHNDRESPQGFSGRGSSEQQQRQEPRQQRQPKKWFQELENLK